MLSGSLPLRPGDAGNPVLDLQRRLAGAGHPCGDDDLGEQVGHPVDDRRGERRLVAGEPQDLAAEVAVAEAEQLAVAAGEILLGDATYHRELLAQRIGI